MDGLEVESEPDRGTRVIMEKKIGSMPWANEE